MPQIDFVIDTTHENVSFYYGGQPDGSRVVGIESKRTRVARYAINSATGATGISLLLNIGGVGDGAEIPLRFYISTDPQSHVDADASAEFPGDLTLDETGKIFTGEAKIFLLPGVTYYLWVFPNGTADENYGWYSWYNTDNNLHTVTLIGGAGVVYIGNADGTVDMYQFYVGNGNGADLVLPYLGNGSGADLLS